MGSIIRPLRHEDAEPIAEIRRRTREFHAPWEPLRDDEFFEPSTQRALVERDLVELEAGRLAPFVICTPDGTIAGGLNLNGITRGALQSAALGYWLDEARTGQGLATGAVREALTHAFAVLGLHRVQAETLLHNVASQHVLRRAGFQPYGVAPRYLRIAGRWQDHLLFHAFATESDD